MDLLADFMNALEEFIELIEKYWDEVDAETTGLWVDKGWNSSDIYATSFEISYLIEGSAILNMNNRKYPAKKGNFFFTDLSFHSFCNDGHFKLYYITFRIKDINLYNKVKLCFNRLSACIQPGGITGLDEHFTGFYVESTLTRPYNKITAKYHFINVLIKFYRYLGSSGVQDGKKAFTSKNENIISELIKYLNENYMEKINLKQLSKKWLFNPRYLNNIFKNNTGYTIIKYLIKIRIEKGKRLLGFTSLDVTDIALETGFCDCQHFCKTFKALEGITPSEFRNIFLSG